MQQVRKDVRCDEVVVRRSQELLWPELYASRGGVVHRPVPSPLFVPVANHAQSWAGAEVAPLRTVSPELLVSRSDERASCHCGKSDLPCLISVRLKAMQEGVMLDVVIFVSEVATVV